MEYCEFDHWRKAKKPAAFICPQCSIRYCEDCAKDAGGVCTEHDPPALRPIEAKK